MRLSVPGLVCLLVAGTIAAPGAQQAPAVSLARIRKALAKPPSRLTLTERPPDFSVRIEERRPMWDIFDVPPWASPELFFAGYTRPKVFAPVEGAPKGGFATPAGGTGTDIFDPARSMATGVARALRVRSAHREVERTLAEYCAAQPNGGAAVEVCSTLPAIR